MSGSIFSWRAQKKPKTHLECPTCRRSYERPESGWDYILVKIQVGLGVGLIAWFWLDPPSSYVSNCAKMSIAVGQSTATCYPPTGLWLALGWGLVVVAYTGIAWWVHWDFRYAARRLGRWKQALPVLVTVEDRR